MKNLKRIFSLALAGTMLAGMLTVGASAADFTDADSIKNNEAVDTMVALNIINGKDDGSFAPEATVTRAEMAKMITIMLNGGSEPALTANASNAKFTDIGGHWAQKYIEYCVSQNVIAGRGDGTFAPDATVTGTEAAKMALTALGYNSEVFNFTGIDWEVNVNAAANAPSANLYDGLRNINPGEGLSRDNAAQMLYNALDANVVEISYNITSNGVETGYVISDKKTMMTERFGAVKVVGIVTGNEIATIGQATAEDKGETVIELTNEDDVKTFGNASVTLKVSTDASVLGRTVSAYVKSNAKASGADVMGSVVLTNDDKVVTDTSGKKLADLAKDNKLTIPAGVKTNKDYTATEKASPVAGDTTIMIDNNGDKKVDYIFVVTYQVAQISKIDTKNEKVTFKGLTGVTRVDFEDVIDYEEFEEDDYVLVNTFGGKYYLTAPETVEGELTEYKVNDDSEATKLTIDSTTYDVSAVEVNATTELTSAKTLGEANLETEAVFYLDANGKIVAMGEAKEAAAQYAISWGGASGNKIDNNRIKLTLEDGTTAIYTVDSKSDVKIGGTNGSEFSGKGITNANKNAVGALIAYTIKSNGNVSLKVVENTASKTAAFEKGKTLVGGVSATANTLFFHVETVGGNGADKDDVKEVEVFTGYKNAPSTEEGTILVATNTKTSKAVAAVFVNPVTNSGKAKVADHLWLKSTGTSNKDYTNATVILAGGEEADIKIAAGEDTDKGMYLFTINSDGYYELDKASGDKDAANFYKAGTVYSISADTVVIGTTESNVTEYFMVDSTVEVDATKDGASIEKNATVEVIFDKESEEVLMIVVTKAAPDEE